MITLQKLEDNLFSENAKKKKKKIFWFGMTRLNKWGNRPYKTKCKYVPLKVSIIMPWEILG